MFKEMDDLLGVLSRLRLDANVNHVRRQVGPAAKASGPTFMEMPGWNPSEQASLHVYDPIGAFNPLVVNARITTVVFNLSQEIIQPVK